MKNEYNMVVFSKDRETSLWTVVINGVHNFSHGYADIIDACRNCSEWKDVSMLEDIVHTPYCAIALHFGRNGFNVLTYHEYFNETEDVVYILYGKKEN